MPHGLIHNSATVLEFDALRDLLRGYTSSPLGQAKIAGLAPSTDSSWISEQQELAGEMREFRRVGGRFDFSGLLDVTRLLAKARIGGDTIGILENRSVLGAVDSAEKKHERALTPPASQERHGG